MGLPESSQPKTIRIVGFMMTIRWLGAQVKEKKRQEAPQNVQFVSDRRRMGSFQRSFCNALECSNNRSKENEEDEWL